MGRKNLSGTLRWNVASEVAGKTLFLEAYVSAILWGILLYLSFTSGNSLGTVASLLGLLGSFYMHRLVKFSIKARKVVRKK